MCVVPIHIINTDFSKDVLHLADLGIQADFRRAGGGRRDGRLRDSKKKIYRNSLKNMMI